MRKRLAATFLCEHRIVMALTIDRNQLEISDREKSIIATNALKTRKNRIGNTSGDDITTPVGAYNQ
jgi:hypothetical protein